MFELFQEQEAGVWMYNLVEKTQSLCDRICLSYLEDGKGHYREIDVVYLNVNNAAEG